MLRLTVGLTGGIGSGKSMVLKVWKELGAEAVSCDEIAHELLASGGPAARRIEKEFGVKDRKSLARIVFKDPKKLRRLEKIIHPEILKKVKKALAASPRPVAAVDAPVLYEAGIEDWFDLIVVVDAPLSRRLGWAAARNGFSRQDFLARERLQMPLSRKAALADVVLKNEGARSELKKKAKDLWKAFQLIAKSPPEAGRES